MSLKFVRKAIIHGLGCRFCRMGGEVGDAGLASGTVERCEESAAGKSTALAQEDDFQSVGNRSPNSWEHSYQSVGNTPPNRLGIRSSVGA